MCLSVVTKTIANPTSKVSYAWKVFEKSKSGKLYFPFYNEGRVITGQWLEARFISVQPYEIGFHSFTSKKAAQKNERNSVRLSGSS